MTRGKKKKPAWNPFVCCGETMQPKYRKGKPGTFNCRHCGNIRPQRVSPKAPRVWGLGPVPMVAHINVTIDEVLKSYPYAIKQRGLSKEGS